MGATEEKQPQKRRSLRPTVTMLLIVALAALALFTFLRGSDQSSSVEVPLSTLIARIHAQTDVDSIPNLTAQDNKITFTNWIDPETSESSELFSYKQSETDLVTLFSNENVPLGSYTIEFQQPSWFANIFGILISILPFLLIGVFLIFMLRQAQGGGGSSGPFGFGRSRAKVITGDRPNVTFYDVAGAAEAKEELKEVVDFLRFPERFTALGAQIPRGVLLVGPPGTGKTLLSRAVAGEAGAPFFAISGSEFVEMFVGVGAARVRDLFGQARKSSPAIIFIDEIDAVGRQRGSGLGGGHDEREQTLNQILVEMDGFTQNTGIIVIAATNRPDILDPALLRPGRFDRRVILDSPDLNGRLEILEVHSKGKPLAKGIKLKGIAAQTPGFSGADLANLVNEAALLTARRDKTAITIDELTEAIDRVSMGPARKSRVLSPQEREMVAYHEAGHAVVSHLMPEGKGVGKVSIIARGQAGGFTRYEQDDRILHTLGEMKALIAAALGGRVAEEIKYGQLTTGAQSDIENATRLARNMVTRLGMSVKLGPRLYGKREESIFLGKEISGQKDYSERSEVMIDSEINALLAEGRQNAHKLIKGNFKKMEKVVAYLLEHETIESADFKAIMKGRKPALSIGGKPAKKSPLATSVKKTSPIARKRRSSIAKAPPPKPAAA